jgi:hypothetical protein
VYVIAQDSITGARSARSTATFVLNALQPSGSTCDQQRANYNSALDAEASSGASFSDLLLAGDPSVVRSKMSKTNGLKNSAFNCTLPFGRRSRSLLQGRRSRSLLQDADAFDLLTLEGLSATLSTLSVSANESVCACVQH